MKMRLIILTIFLVLALGVMPAWADVGEAEDDDEVEIQVEEDVEAVVEAAVEAGEVETEVKKKVYNPMGIVVTFVEPDQVEIDNRIEFPVNKPIRFLVGVRKVADSAGNGSFSVDRIEARFLYPTDHSFSVLNLTTAEFKKVVREEEDTFSYEFGIHENFAGRRFDFVSVLHYFNVSSGEALNYTLYNETILIAEPEWNFDFEQISYYVLVAATTGLAAFVWFSWSGNTKSLRKASNFKQRNMPVEMGTTDVDVSDWVPEETKKYLKKKGNSASKKAKR